MKVAHTLLSSGDDDLEHLIVLPQLAAVGPAAFQALIALQGKAGQPLTTHEWLMSVRSRIGIPGGTCEFDLPGYYAWQQHPAQNRQAAKAAEPSSVLVSSWGSRTTQRR